MIVSTSVYLYLFLAQFASNDLNRLRTRSVHVRTPYITPPPPSSSTRIDFESKTIHNWHGDVTHGLALDVGDFVEILEETTHWFRGTCPRKPRKVGLFPKTYIQARTAKLDPVVGECTLVLREWSEIWKKLFVEREEYKFTSLRKVMLGLLESRRELLSATLTQDQTYDLQMKVISKIDWGNR
ncbi:hypothetical protein pipiens_015335 [Culex pipiens pipiens]|uniref:SH3 domain-containing protein n=1 Tax=Culex pipiens pipiens TaxID=38569 RepID=A0ABD1CQV0_CULPP